jgi:hypothetical protein
VFSLQLFLEVHGEDTKKFCRGQSETIECLSDEKNKLFFLEVLLHSSDISNPFKPFVICEQWADLVAAEFFQQGDKESSLGLDISPMMDRKNSNLFNMQLGFIEFVVSPLVNCKLLNYHDFFKFNCVTLQLLYTSFHLCMIWHLT